MFTSRHRSPLRRGRRHLTHMHSLKPVATILLLCLLGGPALHAAARQKSRPSAFTLPAGARLDATLRTSLDTRYTVATSSVVAVVSRDVKRHGHILIPHGTQLLGRVLASHRAEQGQPAQLQVLFHQALLPNGDTISLSGGISSLFTRARRAALDGNNGIGAPSGSPAGLEPPANVGGAAPPPRPYRSTSPSTYPVSTPAAAHDGMEETSAPASHSPELLCDSDGVALTISPATAGGTLLTGRGPTIRLNAGVKIEIQISHAVPVPVPGAD